MRQRRTFCGREFFRLTIRLFRLTPLFTRAREQIPPAVVSDAAT
jgi:hypothetical protein